MANHQLAKFVGHRHCGSGDITILGCHVILQGHVIKGLCYSMGRSRAYQGKLPSCQVWWL